MNEAMAAMLSEANAGARTARMLAEQCRHLPRVAHHAQVVVGWAGVIRSRAEQAGSTDICSGCKEFSERFRAALAQALAEIIGDRISRGIPWPIGRHTPPPPDVMLGMLPPEFQAGIPEDTWIQAWDLFRKL